MPGRATRPLLHRLSMRAPEVHLHLHGVSAEDVAAIIERHLPDG
jgi:hypothetical protein